MNTETRLKKLEDLLRRRQAERQRNQASDEREAVSNGTADYDHLSEEELNARLLEAMNAVGIEKLYELAATVPADRFPVDFSGDYSLLSEAELLRLILNKLEAAQQKAG